MSARTSLFLLILLAPSGARAEDWLQSAENAARSAAVPGEASPEKPKPGRQVLAPASRFFLADLPSVGWRPNEEEGASGSVVRVFGPDDPSGRFRAVLSVRLVDRDSAGFQPVKRAIDAMRAADSAVARSATSVRPLRVPAGLARTFEVVETRRLPAEEGPSTPIEIHHYVAVIPHGGEAYFVVRLATARANYLDFRDDFVRFLRSLRPLGATGR
ncbi:MAG TPA: hypothetical protein DCZ01_07590 [Elusimicrobia bacterium]|nr:MAG: hypothetical protein A2X37_03315 [Elusimicrobia bacterium GWA2_66_18]OGR74380.1 MAG: hypothetical protein A2X40_10240 [Elusimicrobia bacterium GWC2_65_9]HAZ08367.1 hypothetical protein [Elusimicrobiota bacterium]